MPTAIHGVVMAGDATQEHIVMGIIMNPLLHASHAPLDTIVEAGIQLIAIED